MQQAYPASRPKKEASPGAGPSSPPPYSDLWCLRLAVRADFGGLTSGLDRQLPPLGHDLLALLYGLLAQANRLVETRGELLDGVGLNLAELLIEGLQKRRLIRGCRLPEAIELLHLRINLIFHDLLASLGLCVSEIGPFHVGYPTELGPIVNEKCCNATKK